MTDVGKNVESGTFTATGQSSALGIAIKGKFNLLMFGAATTVATVSLERSFDEGVTFTTVTDKDGLLIEHVFASDVQLNASFEEPESNVRYRLNCTAFTSGTVTFRLSQNKTN